MLALSTFKDRIFNGYNPLRHSILTFKRLEAQCLLLRSSLYWMIAGEGKQCLSVLAGMIEERSERKEMAKEAMQE